MPEMLLISRGLIVAALALAFWVHRHQRDIDDYEEREYRDPPPGFTLPGR